MAGNILAAIGKLELAAEGNAFRLGASIGIAYTDAGEYDAETVLRAADSACYQAKRGGRNRIEIRHAEPSYEASGRFHLGQFEREAKPLATRHKKPHPDADVFDVRNSTRKRT